MGSRPLLIEQRQRRVRISPTDDRTVSNVLDELERAQAALERCLSISGPVRFEDRFRVAEAYDALRDLDRWLPSVDAWAVGYTWGFRDDGDEPKRWTTWSAHATRATAGRWMAGWVAHEKAHRLHRDLNDWGVRFTPVRVHQIVPKGCTMERWMAGVFA